MAAGDLLGLQLAGRGAPPPGAALLAAVLLVLASAAPALRRRVRRPSAALWRGGARPVAAPVLLVACGLGGVAAGLAAGSSVVGSCAAELEARSAVRASGTAVHAVRPAGQAAARPASGAPRGGTRRLELRSVRLRAGTRSCRLPRVLARVAPPGETLAAGSRVAVEGRWIRFGAAGAQVRPLGRYGMVRGRLAPLADAASVEGPGRVGSVVLTLRARAADRLDARLPPDVAPLARAIVLARREGLDAAVARRFADAGMAHLLAISGLHVGALAGGALWVVARVVRGRRRYLAAAGLVAAYVALIGAPPAATRASILFAGWSAGRFRGAPVRPTELLGAAAAATLLADPAALLGASFQLSFAGFSGLLLGAAVGRRAADAAGLGRGRGGRRPRAALLAFAAGAGAFAATAPFAAHHFQRAAPIAVLSNFVGAPLVTAALTALVGVLALPAALAGLAAGAATWALRLLLSAVDVFAALPFGHGAAAPPGPVFWTVVVCLGVAAVRIARGSTLARAATPAGLAAAVALGGSAAAAALGSDRTLLCQLDVGQGDAAVVRTRSGHWLAFDAGPRFGSRDAGLRVVLPFMRDRGARSLELFVLSHPHLDHLGGAGALLQRFRVAGVLDAGNPVPSAPYQEFLDAVAEDGARWRPASAGAGVRIDEVRVTVLGPVEEGLLWRSGPRDANETSVAVRVTVADRFVYLNTGDAPVEQEEEMLDRWPADSLRAILLKAGHHGSRTSSGRRWLEAVRPRLAVVSAGAGNRYGHPHSEALDRLRDAGVDRVWRTDPEGHLCVEVRPDGRWRVRGEERWRPGLGKEVERGGQVGRDPQPLHRRAGARAPRGPG